MVTRGRIAAGPNRRLSRFHPLSALAFLAGVLCVYVSPQLPALWWHALLLLSALVLLRRYPEVAYTLLACAVGALWMSYVSQQRLLEQWPETQHGQERWLSGYIADLPERKAQKLSFLFKSADQPGMIKVSWYQPDIQPPAGQCLRLELRMRTPRGALNPGGFDYQGWLFRQHITATAYVRDYQPCGADTLSYDYLSRALLRWRQDAADKINAALPDHEMAAVVQALTLGLRNDFQRSDWDMLRRTGTSHLMAISGLHIGIVVGWVYWLMAGLWKRLPIRLQRMPAKHAGLLAGSLAGVIYALATGFGLPAQRALLMLLVFVLASWLGRRVTPLQALSLALVAVLLLDPYSVADAGFWLSFGAVFWIFYLLSYRWHPQSKLKTLFYLQLGLGLALMPVTLFWFAEASWIAPAVNLLLVPLFTLLVPLTLLAVFTLLAVPAIGQWCLLQIADLLGWVWQLLTWLDASLQPAFSTSSVSLLGLLLAMLAVAWLCAPRGWPARSIGLFFLLPIFLYQPSAQDKLPPDSLRMTVLDVGQGLAVIIEAGDKVLVYDAGPAYAGSFNAGDMVVVPYLRYRGIRQVDVLMISHGDLDHRGGAEAIVEAMPVKQRLGFGGEQGCRKGTQWQWAGVTFSILHPDTITETGNNSSCVLHIRTGRSAVLLAGDIEQRVEKHLVREQRQSLDADVLIAPHHGSKTSSSAAFIDAVSPQYTIFSAGWHNRWGFPKPEIVRRYQAAGVIPLSTAEHGAVTVMLDARTGLSGPWCWRRQSARLWRPVVDACVFATYD